MASRPDFISIGVLMDAVMQSALISSVSFEYDSGALQEDWLSIIIVTVFENVNRSIPPNCFPVSIYIFILCGKQARIRILCIIGTELLEIQRQVDALHEPTDPNLVQELLRMYRDVMLLKFDIVVRHCIPDTFIHKGNWQAFQVFLDNLFVLYVCIHHMFLHHLFVHCCLHIMHL